MNQTLVIRYIVCFCMIISLFSCKRNNHQIILLKNLSDENIYFVLSEKGRLINADKIGQVRPKSSIPLNAGNEDFDQKIEYDGLKHSLYRYLIEKDSSEILLTSEAVSIFVDAISLQEIIADRFNGELSIFIITGQDLMNFTDQEIMTKGKYSYFKSIKSDEIISDTLTLEYY